MHLPKLILESSGRSSISGSSSNTRSSSSSLVLLLYINSNMFSLYSIKDIGEKTICCTKNYRAGTLRLSNYAL